MKKILITGGSGLFASNACYVLRETSEVFCVSRSTKEFLPQVKYLNKDISNLNDCIELFEITKPELVINAAGKTSVEDCEKNYQEGYNSNVLGAVNLAKISREEDIPFVHLSTDHFSNSNIFCSSENQIELPKNNYAALKLEAERLILKENPNALIARTNFFGWGHKERHSFSDFILSGAESDSDLNLFEDVIFSPIYVDCLLDDILSLVDKKQSGVFNIVGNKSLTKYTFGFHLLNFFKFKDFKLNRRKLKDVPSLVQRPYDMSLNRFKVDSILGHNSNRNLEKMFLLLKKDKHRKDYFNSYLP